jgi:DNA helicase-2/ATP-dependent DNA helicase PcrA
MNDLTLSQQTAINSDEQHIVCLAGPGSGKTRTLTERLARLINDGVSPKEIICITFTNAAAREIEKRLDKAFFANTSFSEDVQLFYCGTLHGFCLRLLKQHGEVIGFKKEVAMLAEDDQKALVKQVIADLKFKGTMTAVTEQLKKGPQMFQHGPEADSSHTTHTYIDVELIAAEYYHRLRKASLCDFDSLLKFGCALLKRLSPETMKAMGIRFLFWDEFQDSSDDDAEILYAFPEGWATFVVGDPDQAIYGFRGGSPKHLIELAETDRLVVYLEQNFRSDQQICEAANRLISHNEQRVGKSTISASDQTGMIKTFSTFNEAQEILGISQDILANVPGYSAAVLLRSNALADRFAEGLAAQGIAIAKKEKVAKPSDWKICRTLINLLTNPDNDLLAYWWLVETKDSRFAAKIKLEALEAFKSINDHFLKLPRATSLGAIPQTLAKCGISQETIAIVNKAIGTLPTGAGLAELSFALSDEDLHRKESGEGVTVTTMHSAKGREWDAVYLPAFEDGCCPILSKSSDMEEERRLAFVAITRARHRLVISYARTRKPAFGGWKPEETQPSRFIPECQ